MFSTNANVNSAQKSAVQTEQSANTSRSEINLAKVSISDQPMLKKPRLVEESLDQCMPEKRYLSQQSKNTISLGLQDLYGKNSDGTWSKKATINHDNKIEKAVFSPDSRYVVTTGHDKTVKISMLQKCDNTPKAMDEAK